MRLLYAGERCKLVIDSGVVVVAVEEARTCALCVYSYRKSGVRIGSEVNTGLVVQQVCDGNGERLVASVEQVLFLDSTFSPLMDLS